MERSRPYFTDDSQSFMLYQGDCLEVTRQLGEGQRARPTLQEELLGRVEDGSRRTASAL